MNGFPSWRNCLVKPRQIKEAEQYLFAINQIQTAKTGFVNVMESNLFFDEACQCLVNAIDLFQYGYFDAAFYMLRQSIETSIGTLYLVSNKDKMEKWKNLEKGFEQGKMAQWLSNNEEALIEMKKCMSDFFIRIQEDQTIMNKYVHKQGFQSFYTIHRNKKDEEFWMINTQSVNGVSEAIFKVGMCLPAGPYVSDDDVKYIVETIKENIIG